MVGADPARRARSDRRRAPLDRRSRSCRSKIDEGREQDIRECIGCNICISSWHDSVPVRCTQNPTHRRGVAPRLAPGAHRAGRQRGLGAHRGRRSGRPRVRADARAARLRGDAGGSRRGDRRPAALRDPAAGTGHLGPRARLAPRPARSGSPTSTSTAAIALGARRSSSSAHATSSIATGARWTRLLYSPLEVPAGELEGPGRLHARRRRRRRHASRARWWSSTSTTTTWAARSPSISRPRGAPVSYVTPAGHASAWTIMSNEQPQVHRALARAGVALHTLSRVAAFDGATATVANQFTERDADCRAGRCSSSDCGGRTTRCITRSWRAATTSARRIASVTRIGDARAPGRHRARRAQRTSLRARARHARRGALSARLADHRGSRKHLRNGTLIASGRDVIGSA